MAALGDQQFDACYALYEQGKFAECVKLGERNLTDLGMSPYLRIKTHCVLAGAADEWLKAEVSSDGLLTENTLETSHCSRERVSLDLLYNTNEKKDSSGYRGPTGPPEEP
jgi:hypothetical protein